MGLIFVGLSVGLMKKDVISHFPIQEFLRGICDRLPLLKTGDATSRRSMI